MTDTLYSVLNTDMRVISLIKVKRPSSLQKMAHSSFILLANFKVPETIAAPQGDTHMLMLHKTLLLFFVWQ